MPRQWELQPDERELDLCQLPLEGFSGHDRPESRFQRIPADLRAVPQHDRVDGGDLQSQQHRIPAHRRAHHRSVRAMSRERQLQSDQRGLRDLPPEGFPGCDPTESRAGEFLADLHAVPQYDVLEWSGLRSLDYRIRADRRAYDPAVRAVPRQQQLHAEQREHELRVLPSERLPGDHESESRFGRLPAELPAMPQHNRLDGSELRPLDHRFPLDGRSYNDAVRAVPREQQLQPDQREHGLRELPLEGFSGHHQPEPRFQRLPADVPAVPQYDFLEWSELRPLDHRFPLDGRSYNDAVRAVSREQQLQPDQ